MKKSAANIINQAILDAKNQDIKIVRRPMFSWMNGFEKPTECDATGAILFKLNYGYNRPKDWPVIIQNHLGIGVFSLWCFWMGWSYNNQIQLAITNKEGDITGWKEESVSRFARQLARKFTKK